MFIGLTPGKEFFLSENFAHLAPSHCLSNWGQSYKGMDVLEIPIKYYPSYGKPQVDHNTPVLKTWLE